MLNYKIRIGELDEVWFLESMLYTAVNWDQNNYANEQSEILQSPEIVKILQGWGTRKGDVFFICQTVGGELLGSVWYRFWTMHNHSYGFVDENTPEIGLGVVKNFRGRGIGSTLLNHIIKYAKDKGIQNLSLSVDPENFAVSLYQKTGFKKQFMVGNSWTMLTSL